MRLYCATHKYISVLHLHAQGTGKDRNNKRRIDKKTKQNMCLYTVYLCVLSVIYSPVYTVLCLMPVSCFMASIEMSIYYFTVMVTYHFNVTDEPQGKYCLGSMEQPTKLVCVVLCCVMLYCIIVLYYIVLHCNNIWTSISIHWKMFQRKQKDGYTDTDITLILNAIIAQMTTALGTLKQLTQLREWSDISST